MYEDSEKCFIQWLSQGQGLYWISGKPGSGKSTLMRYLLEHDSVIKYLQEGTDLQPWTILGFFFDFRAGETLPNTFEGLLRSLLAQLVQQVPNLAEDVKASGVDKFEVEGALKWSLSRLRLAFQRALTNYGTHVCLFIDALDEYEGNYQTLIDFFQEIDEQSQGYSTRIKLCLASRPEPLILQNFRGSIGIRIEDHNSRDINEYSSQRLRQAIQAWDEDVELLSREVSKNANGVFLWVRLAIDDLLEGLAEGETLAELYERLQDIPADLKNMFSHVMAKVKSKYRLEASIMLRLVCYAARPLTVEELRVAVSFALGTDIISTGPSDMNEIARFENRVRARSAGLLEITNRRLLNYGDSSVPPSDVSEDSEENSQEDGEEGSEENSRDEFQRSE